MNELDHIFGDVLSDLEKATKIRNIKSKWEELSHLLDKVESMIDAKEINATELIAIVSEYKRIKSVDE